MKNGTLIRLLKEEIQDRNLQQSEIAKAIGFTRSYINRMLNAEKMSTDIFEQIMDASGVTLQDLARREAADIVVDDIGGRFSALEGFMQAIQAENLPDRVAKLESQIAILQRKNSS